MFIPTYEGKIFDPTTNKTINNLKKHETQIIKELSKLDSNEKLLRNNEVKTKANLVFENEELGNNLINSKKVNIIILIVAKTH